MNNDNTTNKKERNALYHKQYQKNKYNSDEEFRMNKIEKCKSYYRKKSRIAHFEKTINMLMEDDDAMDIFLDMCEKKKNK